MEELANRSTTLPSLRSRFEQLFAALESAGYAWEPQTPDRLQSCRRGPEGFDPLTRFFGLGAETNPEELEEQGLPGELVRWALEHRPAVSRIGGTLVAHHHWFDGPRPGDYVYLGRESLELSKRIKSVAPALEGQSILDLGSGSGALALAVAPYARKVLGIELSAQAVEWATATAQAYGHEHVAFRQARIGTPQAEAAASGQAWDNAIFNPPLAIPAGAPRPSRDGGHLGIEYPLLFLDFASRHLRPGGQAIFSATNPIVGGRSMLFEQIDSRRWKIEERCLHHDWFNRSLSRKDNYGALGVQRVELWFLRLRLLRWT